MKIVIDAEMKREIKEAKALILLKVAFDIVDSINTKISGAATQSHYSIIINEALIILDVISPLLVDLHACKQ